MDWEGHSPYLNLFPPGLLQRLPWTILFSMLSIAILGHPLVSEIILCHWCSQTNTVVFLPDVEGAKCIFNIRQIFLQKSQTCGL